MNYLEAKTSEEKKQTGFALLEELGFKPFSRNNNVHIQVRSLTISIDFWPTTGKAIVHVGESKMDLKDKTLIVLIFQTITCYKTNGS